MKNITTEFITPEEYAEIEQLRKLHDKYYSKFHEQFNELYKERIDNEFLSDLFFEKYGDDMADEDIDTLWFEYILDGTKNREELNNTINEMTNKSVAIFIEAVKNSTLNPKKGN